MSVKRKSARMHPADKMLLKQMFAMTRITETEERMRGLRTLGRAIFIDRNAEGLPKRDRARIKAEARPYLRRAIKHARQSRDALRLGNIAFYECERDRARMERAFALLEFFRPFANKVGKAYVRLAQVSALGVAETKRNTARPELDDLIRACFARGEATRHYTKEWAGAFHVSVDTIERAVNRVKKESA
jgi:hypothetical protein